MQSSLLVKRNLLTLLENGTTEKVSFFLEPKKKVKANLKIEVADSFADFCEPLATSTTHAGQTKFSFRNSLSLQTSMAASSTSPRCRERSPYAYESSNFFDENEERYDNFYKEEEFFNVTMRKCHRRKMEDRATFEIADNNESKGNSFFGIYDGHRNSYVSDYLQRNLHKMMLNHPDINEQPIKAIKETFCKIDQDVCRNQEKLNIQGGSTALCALINPSGMHVANAGDSKAVLISGNQIFNLNIEHRATNEEEKNQVESRGGVVFEKKGQTTTRFLVQGALELTRSIGDISYKQYITSEPDILEHKFSENDEYLILASDGFWNEINEKQLLELVKNYGNSKGLSKFLVEEAMKKKEYSIDNITLIVVDIKKYLQTA